MRRDFDGLLDLAADLGGVEFTWSQPAGPRGQFVLVWVDAEAGLDLKGYGYTLRSAAGDLWTKLEWKLPALRQPEEAEAA